MSEPTEQTRYESLMSITPSSGIGPVDAVKSAGELIDLAHDLRRTDGLKHAINLLTSALNGNLSPSQKATACYYLGNAWSSVRQLSRTYREESWDWEQPEIEHEIVAYRHALRGVGTPGFSQTGACAIYTNLGNLMNHIGRFTEAIAYWDAALVIDGSFAMAIGNKGVCLRYYAGVVYDDGHRGVLAKHAHDLLKKVASAHLHPEAQQGFETTCKQLAAVIGEERIGVKVDMDGYPLGDGEAERAYRKWCLRERLFLNPLNDLGPHTIAARDVLSVPSIVVPIGEGPYYHGFFNQMKQEFVSARYLFYEGANSREVHFSDRDVLLFNTMDYPVYALAVEKQKLAFRSAYSILDKVGFFLNHYLRLGIPEKSVTFRTLWYENRDRRQGLRQEFVRRRNWPLRGLFWLAKDLYEDTPGFREAIEPEARNLAEIRNHLEHKYLKLHEGEQTGRANPPDTITRALTDTLAYSAGRDTFRRQTLHVLHLARAALVYLSLGIRVEEQQRAAGRSADAVVPPAFLDTWDDEWKR